ncbi:MAG: hypothetical protein Q9199_002130 [Rusavskia elegans]
MPTSAGHVNGPISIGLDLDSNATSHLEKAEIVPLESPISNATLGFEKILVVNLPERTDRRDTLTLTAAIGNILLDFLPAVRGEIGDDADWDLALKFQLQSFASITRNMSSTSPSFNSSSSPYGTDWDILWLGTCATPPAPGGTKSFQDPQYDELLAARNDNNEQISNQLDEWLNDKDSATIEELETSDFPNDIGNPSKTLPTSDDGITSKKPSLQSPETKSNVSDIDNTSPSFTPASRPRTRAYHHSKKFSPSPPDFDLPNSTPPDRDNPIPLDNTPALSKHSTADDSQPFLNTPIPARPPNDKRKRCIAVWPELFGQHRAAGAYAKDSDTGNAGKEAGNRKTGKTAKIAESTVGRMERELGRWGDDVDWETAMQQG